MARFSSPISDRAATANVTRLYRAATDEQRQAGRDWYADANSLAVSLAATYGLTVEQVAGVKASVSPLNSWGANVNLAVRILREHAAGRTVTTGYLGCGLGKAAPILAGADIATTLNSPKITNFWRCIATSGATDAVCIDRHAFDIVVNLRHRDAPGKGDARLPVRPAVNGARYSWAASAYLRAAAILSAEAGRTISASEVQATTWLAWRRRYWSAGAFDGHTLSGS